MEESTNAEMETVETFDYLKTVKMLLGIAEDSKDGLLTLLIDATKQSILNYCNRSDLPEELNYVLCKMVADEYNVEYASNPVGEISAMSEDGRSVSFATGSKMDSKVKTMSELNRFKRLYKL